MATWRFTAKDNSGKFQLFTVKASTKEQAIKKGMEKAKKQASGNINSWDCKLIKTAN